MRPRKSPAKNPDAAFEDLVRAIGKPILKRIKQIDRKKPPKPSPGPMAPWPLEAERELWSDLCTPGRHPESLWWFLRIAWGAEWHLERPSKRSVRWLTTRVHKPIIRSFQDDILEWKRLRREGKGEPYYVRVEIPRDWGKSVSLTKAGSLWAHLDEPDLVTYIGSEIHPKAKGFLGSIKRVMLGRDKDAWFTWLYGDWFDAEREWNTEQVVHGYREAESLTEPSFGTFGVDTGLTGYHPDMVFWDDPLSATKLRAGGDWLKIVKAAVAAAYYALKSDSFFCFVLTRYQDGDVAGYLNETDGVLVWKGMPCRDERVKGKIGQGLWRVYFLQARDRENVTNYIEGEPVLPEVDSHRKLLALEKRDPQGYASQKMNEPGTGEHMPLAQEQIDQIWVDRDSPIPILDAVMCLDTAFKDETRKATGDDNAVVVWFRDLRQNGIRYLDRALASDTWRSEDMLTAMVNTAADLRRRGIRLAWITDEKMPAGMDQLWGQAIEAAFIKAGLRVPQLLFIPRQGRNKVTRITTAAGYWVEGYVRLYRSAPGVGKLVSQMLRIGFSDHDDVADAAADIFNPEIWSRPERSLNQRAEDLGDYPVQPGDDVLKAGKVGSGHGELDEMYAEQNPWAVRYLEEFEDPYGGRREPV